jgi:hypothetical protein
MDPEEVISIQSSNVFNRSHAMWAITTLKLPNTETFKYWLVNHSSMLNHSSDDTATASDIQLRKDEDAGMGRVRMALVKMGCRVNLDATNTVSYFAINLGIELMVGMRNWSIDLLCPRWKQDS